MKARLARLRLCGVALRRMMPAAIIVLASLGASISCHSTPTQPPPPAQPLLSSEFSSWRIDTIGIGSTQLFGAAIVNDTDMWVVGEIYVLDSTGKLNIHPYNAAHFDGKSWTLEHITVFLPPYMDNDDPIYLAYVASPHDIWFVSRGGGATRLHDGVWNPITDFTYGGPRIGEAWGTSSSDIYFAGGIDVLTHYNGIAYVDIKTWTGLQVCSVCGDKNADGSAAEVLCVASNAEDSPPGLAIFRVTGTGYTLAPVSDSGLSKATTEIWFKSGRKYLAGGDGLYWKRSLDDPTPWQKIPRAGVYQGYIDRILGLDTNDIVLVGDGNTLSHYNGKRWQQYNPFPDVEVYFYNGAMTEHTLLATAVTYGVQKGVAVIGRR